VTATRLKVCCIASADEARQAIAAGATTLGLVSAMPSGPGVIGDDAIAAIAAQVPPHVDTFLLTARVDAEAIAEQHARCRTTALQLVDHVAHAALRRLRGLLPAGVKLVQVVHVLDEGSVGEALAAAPFVDMLLLDSGNPRLAVKELGGTGRTHDWTLSARIRAASPVPVWLAGGLHAGNAVAAIDAVRPHGLDVCSGVREAGALSAHKLTALAAAMLLPGAGGPGG
jgi:phosphoribosylanthranilate isomerase